MSKYAKIFRNTLEEEDDVQNVYTNVSFEA